VRAAYAREKEADSSLSTASKRKIPPKFPNFGKTFPYLPGKGCH
jgi:hypothetical protein